MEGKVCGTATEVRQLSSYMEKGVTAARAGVDVVKAAKSVIESAWEDNGVVVVEEFVRAVESSLIEVEGQMPGIKKHMEAYAEFLERT